MAQLPRRLAPHLGALAAAAALAPAAAAGAVELPGTWHVLVHYRDAKAHNADAERWDDRLWVFEAAGDRLRWTEYPLVVFDDETGRFERRKGTGQYARVIHFWDPSPAQLANIRAGLAVNDRGSETKTLRRQGAGWASGGHASATGASVLTYQETWTIDEPESLPVFRQRDALGGEGVEGLDGLTELRTERVLEGGDLLVGRFERDGTRTGSFEMRRSGTRKELPKKTQSQLQAQAYARAAADDPGLGAAPLGGSAEQRAFAYAPEGATHDDSVRYRFPFDPAVARRLRAGVGADQAITVLGPTSDWSGHRGWAKYSFDFELPKGVQVQAARAGRVAAVGAGFIERDERGGRALPSLQHVAVLHADGTVAVYGHLAEVVVEIGQQVGVGDPIGVAAGPFVHFGVVRNRKDGAPESLPIRFDDGSAEGVVPVTGLSYGGTHP